MGDARDSFACHSDSSQRNLNVSTVGSDRRDDVCQRVSMHMIECKAQRLELVKSNHSKIPVFDEVTERLSATG